MTNRPGLNALRYRAGTFATFLRSMKARLSAGELRGLEHLTARGANDLSIALLDGWAAVADVLTFYQERIANEGYLRTATERRSILELARLVGYSLRPGVAASVYLAYTLEAKSDVTIPAGSRAQSIPGPGELPQSFETSAPLKASADWNNLKPRQRRPQILTGKPGVLYLEGLSTALKPNDPLLFTGAIEPALQRIERVTAEPVENRTKVVLLKAVLDDPVPPRAGFDRLGEIVNQLSKARSLPPRSAARLDRSVASTFRRTADVVPSLVGAFRPEIGEQLYTALENAVVTAPLENFVHALRVTAAPFGHNAPLKPVLDERGVPTGFEEWPIGASVITEVAVILPLPNSELATQRLVSATVRQGTDVETRAVPMPNADVTIDLSNETVKVRAANDGFHFTFSKLGRRVLIKFNDGESQADITADDDPPRTLQRSQSIRYARHGRRVTIQFGRGVAVSVDGASAPTNLKTLALNATYDQILPGSWVVLERPRAPGQDPTRLITKVVETARVSKAEYGLTGQVSELTLEDEWLATSDRFLSDIRGVTVLAQSEKLAPAEEPITDPICKGRIELDHLYAGLDSGRWLVVEGERTDVPGTSGIRAAELVMLASAELDVEPSGGPDDGGAPLARGPRPGEKTHTYLNLATDLAYCYKRDTVTIYGNVIDATHGETRNESLGHGDGTRALQTFALHQHPLTYVAAPIPAGVQSTLEMRVNNVRWHEAPALADLGPADRKFLTRTADDGQVFVTFGNGQRGARLPTGVENVRATYRVGIGKPGNVDAKQVSLLTSRPLGVKEVINPLRASGGADPEGRDRGRKNAPLGVMALDRLVATRDYEHFARTFAGIDKASATALPGASASTVHLTIAGSDNIPIDVHSDLYENLVEALHRFGDPQMSIQVVPCELKLLVLEATVAFAADYLWEVIEKQIREALLDRFGFERQELGEDVHLSEIVSIIHGIRGVSYVDVDVLDSVGDTLAADSAALGTRMEDLAGAEEAPRPPTRIVAETATPARPLPAQLLVFSRDVPDTLILHGIPS